MSGCKGCRGSNGKPSTNSQSTSNVTITADGGLKFRVVDPKKLR